MIAWISQCVFLCAFANGGPDQVLVKLNECERRFRMDIPLDCQMDNWRCVTVGSIPGVYAAVGMNDGLHGCA